MVAIVVVVLGVSHNSFVDAFGARKWTVSPRLCSLLVGLPLGILFPLRYGTDDFFLFLLIVITPIFFAAHFVSYGIMCSIRDARASKISG